MGVVSNVLAVGESLTPDAQRKLFTYQVEDLAAGVDIAARDIWQAPPGGVTNITRVEILFEQATVGVDGANTLQIVVARAAGAIADSGALAADQVAGTFLTPALANNTGIVAADDITVAVTQGAAANAGLVSIIIYYEQDS